MDGSARFDEICDDVVHRHPGVDRTQMMNRPFKDWVVVPPAHQARWPELVELAL